MTVMNSLRGTDVSPRAAVLSILALVVLIGGAVFGVLKLLNVHAGSDITSAAHRPQSQTAVADSHLAAGNEPLLTPGGEYGMIAARRLFQPLPTYLAASATVQAPVVPPLKVPPLKIVPRAKPIAPARPAGPRLALTGVVELPNGTFALLENLDTAKSQYVRIGGTAFDCQLVELTAQTAVLKCRGQNITLKLGENKPDEQPVATPAAAPAAGTPAPAGGNPTPPNGAQPATPAGGATPRTGEQPAVAPTGKNEEKRG